MSRLKSKRGSYLVEAVLIMPLIVIITVLMMFVSLYMHIMAADMTEMDQNARRIAGEKSSTVFYMGNYENEFGERDSFADKFYAEEDCEENSEEVKIHSSFFFNVAVPWIGDYNNSFSVKSGKINECKTIWKNS